MQACPLSAVVGTIVAVSSLQLCSIPVLKVLLLNLPLL
jgi:hypothetical protein